MKGGKQSKPKNVNIALQYAWKLKATIATDTSPETWSSATGVTSDTNIVNVLKAVTHLHIED